jgi:hypothetical protein
VTREPEQAHLVQVMQGHGRDPGRAKELLGSRSDEWSAFRPEILGTVRCVYADTYTVAVHFADEQAAREGEQKPPPAELAAGMDELTALTVGGPEYLDVREPWIHSPAARG